MLRKYPFITILKNDYNNIETARKIEKENDYLISFYDCLHISFCKKINAILITRDKELIIIARNYIEVFKPEEI